MPTPRTPAAKAAARPPSPIEFRVGMSEPHSHEFEITMDVPALPERASIELQFSAWAPGSYMVRDFARHIYDLAFTDTRGRPLATVRLDKQRWRVESRGQAVRVSYRVFAFEQTVRTSHLDDAHAYWNGTSLFFAVDGELGRPHLVHVETPAGWRISTALPALRGRPASFRAASYDELCDSPFEVGTHSVYSFDVRGARFELALYGRTNADVDRLLSDLESVVSATGAMFGGFPFERYVFIVHALPNRGGGLEHAASTTLDIAGLSFDDDKGYVDFAELAAHEFFHTWNVKRLRDRVLGPFDYSREAYTRLLWFHEGFTEYMESLILLRAGIIDVRRYLRDLADTWNRYVSRPGRHAVLSELSFEAWIKQYKPADNHSNRMVSYYDKGKWAALVLELELREASGGKRGIVELFKRLWDVYGKSGRAFDESELRADIDAVAEKSMRSFFDKYIDGGDELPVPALLRRAGIDVEDKRPGEDDSDETRAVRARRYIGATFTDRAVVRTVVPDSPAWRAGLTYGDEVVAVDGVRATGANVSKRLADKPVGARVELTIFRQDLLRTLHVTVADSPERILSFTLTDKPKARAKALRRGWLGA